MTRSVITLEIASDQIETAVKQDDCDREADKRRKGRAEDLRRIDHADQIARCEPDSAVAGGSPGPRLSWLNEARLPTARAKMSPIPTKISDSVIDTAPSATVRRRHCRGGVARHFAHTARSGRHRDAEVPIWRAGLRGSVRCRWRRPRPRGAPAPPVDLSRPVGSTRAGQSSDRRSGNNAPMSQNSGRKMPRTNMTQWPFLIVMTPRVIARMRYRMPKPPPIQYATTATFRLSSPLNSTG